MNLKPLKKYDEMLKNFLRNRGYLTIDLKPCKMRELFKNFLTKFTKKDLEELDKLIEDNAMFLAYLLLITNDLSMDKKFWNTHHFYFNTKTEIYNEDY